MEDAILKELLDSNDMIILDTCFAMRSEFPQFIEDIEIELLSRKKKIIVKPVVNAELHRKMGSDERRVRESATKAFCIIYQNKNRLFDIEDEVIGEEEKRKAFADAILISDFAKYRQENTMALLTNDYNLGKDIIKLNSLESCIGKKVEVFSLDQQGFLKQNFYDIIKADKPDVNKDEPTVSDNNDDKVIKEDDNVKISNIVTSIAIFAAGFVVGRYGKEIVAATIKAVA